MDLLHAMIEEFAADGYTHIECHCPRCRMTRLRPISWLPRISLGLTIAQLSARLRWCGVRRTSPVGEAVAIERPAGQAVGLTPGRSFFLRRLRLGVTPNALGAPGEIGPTLVISGPRPTMGPIRRDHRSPDRAPPCRGFFLATRGCYGNRTRGHGSDGCRALDRYASIVRLRCALSAAVSCTRSSRGDWKNVLGKPARSARVIIACSTLRESADATDRRFPIDKGWGQVPKSWKSHRNFMLVTLFFTVEML
jgi:hypothetical protein